MLRLLSVKGKGENGNKKVESSAGGDEKEDIMKNNKKLNSIATMSKEELQEVNGGSMYLLKRYPDIFPIGIPAPLWNQGMNERIPEMMDHRVIR